MAEIRFRSDMLVIDVHDIHQYFELTTGRKWDWGKGESFPSNDSFTLVTIGPLEEDIWGNSWWPVEDYDEEAFAQYLAGENYTVEDWVDRGEPNVGVVMQYLYTKGALPEGDYLVQLWW